jgi:hypothetical protein
VLKNFSALMTFLTVILMIVVVCKRQFYSLQVFQNITELYKIYWHIYNFRFSK